MSIFFLNSTNRIYNDKEINKIPQLLFSSGVFNTQEVTQALWREQGDFKIEADGETLNVTAKAGDATVAVTSQGVQQQALISEPTPLTASVAVNSTLPIRNDAVVLRVNQSIITNDQLNSQGSNAVTLTVVAGNSATALSDQEITIALSGDSFLRLADILVPQNATAITQAMITDKRTLVRMTRATKLASDALRLYGIAEDPKVLEQGDIWFNTSEGILKMYDGINTIAIQTRSYDWGYYPPDGVDSKVDQFEAVVDNVGGVGNGSFQVYEIIDALGGGNFTLMAGQVFKMPNIPNPFIRVKMGNPQYQASLAFKIYTVNGSNVPQALVETVASMSADDIPKNDYVNLYLDGSLYTAGQNYMLVVHSTQIGYTNADESQFRTGWVQYSTFTDDSGYLLGTKSSSLSSLTTNPLSLPWSDSATVSRNFIMSIGEREELKFGETDSTGNVHKLSQAFVARSRDIIGFRVIKGAEVGSPTDDITASLYLADENGQPVGNVLTQAVIEEADWLEGGTGTNKEFNLEYDDMIIGQKYVVVLECEDVSDTDNYTIYFGSSSVGMLNRWTTANGWVSMNGDLFYSIIVSANRKIVVTNDQGLIPLNLLDPKQLHSLLPLPAYQQDLSIDTADSITSNEFCSGSNQDGSAFYVRVQGNSKLYRFERDAITGQYRQTHSITPTLSIQSGDTGALVVIGDYLYLLSNNGTNIVCSRFLAADLTGETVMTVPTVACTDVLGAWTDGVSIYVVSNASDNTSRKWEFTSATVLSEVSTASVTINIFERSESSNMYDGKTAYYANPSGSSINLRKLTSINGSGYETTSMLLQPTYSDIQGGSFIINIDETRMYIGYMYAFYDEATPISTRICLLPVTKP